jgi:predicted ATPase/DNA-binding SARP family transcriptional activator
VLIALLGPLEVRDAAGQPVEVVGARVRALLARLALDPGRPVSSAALADAVWADDPPAGERSALQTLVSRLRRAVPDLPIEGSPAGYRLGVDPSDVDVGAFEGLLEKARSTGTRDEAARHLAAALALWRGEPLSDVDGLRFAPAVLARLAERRLGATEDLADALVLAGRADEALAMLTEVVAAQPLRERARSLLMRALWATGRPAEALDEYARLRASLADALGTEPSPALRDLHTSMLRGTHGAAIAVAGNLRRALTSFVGRQAELARTDEALASARLVTLVGPGGAGKTRLAAEASTRWAGGTGDEVWVAELAGVTDPAEVPAAVLSTLNRSDGDGGRIDAGLGGGDRPPKHRLLDELRGRRALLVLDNCEHLLAACADLAESVLGECADVVVLTTTREALAVTGEVLVPVGPLPVPPSDVDGAAVGEYPSVRLFADRMAAVRPGPGPARGLGPGLGPGLDEDDLDVVAEVCRRLDGLPLAIELACARLRTMPLRELAARLSDRFRLLTGGSRTALPRHQTLLAVVGWSWDLFDEQERRLARRLAVFAGGATLDAVEAVCAPGSRDAAIHLGALVDKSFVDFDGERYRMLDTVRAFAADALAAAGEADATRSAHARHFLALAEAAEPELRGHDQLRWLGTLEREYENITAALRWALDSGHAETALRFEVALGWFWFLRGAAGEADAWLDAALAQVDRGVTDPAMLATAFAYDAVNAFNRGDLVRARASASLAVWPAGSPEHPAVALVTRFAGLERFDLGSVFGALSGLADHPEPWVAAAGRLVRGHAAETFGDRGAAVRHFADARAAFLATGDRWGAMLALGSLAGGRSLAGDHDGAMAAFAEAEEMATAVGATTDAAWSRGRIGVERLRAGDVEGAEVDLRHALADGERRWSAVPAALAESGLADVARTRGDCEEAQRLLASAMHRLEGATGALSPRIRVLLLTARSRVELAAGQVGPARNTLRDAMAGAVAIGDRPTVAGVAEAAAELELAAGDRAAAARTLGLAAAARGALDQGSPDVRAVVQAVDPAALAEASTVDPDAAVAELADYAT